MARWLQKTVQGMLNPELKDLTIPVTDAAAEVGRSALFLDRHVSAIDSELALTWYDIGEPLLIHTQPNQAPNPRPYGVCTLLIPALRRTARQSTARKQKVSPGRGSARASPSAPARSPSPKSWTDAGAGG